MRAKLVNEAIADKYAEKEFHMIRPHADFERKFKQDQLSSNNIIVGYNKNEKEFKIFKNPTEKQLSQIENESVRAISDPEGNLYVASYDGNFNHGRMGNALIDAGVIKCPKYNLEVDNYGIYNYNKFITLWVEPANNTYQRGRSSGTTLIYFSDSYENYSKRSVAALINKHLDYDYFGMLYDLAEINIYLPKTLILKYINNFNEKHDMGEKRYNKALRDLIK